MKQDADVYWNLLLVALISITTTDIHPSIIYYAKQPLKTIQYNKI